MGKSPTSGLAGCLTYVESTKCYNIRGEGGGGEVGVLGELGTRRDELGLSKKPRSIDLYVG